MQSYHYEIFVANYAVLVGLVIAGALFWQRVSHRALLWIGALCFLWGAIEVSLPAMVRSTSNTTNDQIVPVLLRLKELSKQDGTLTVLRAEGQASTLVFSPHIEVMRLLPTWTSQGTSLAMGGLDFGSVSEKENKYLLYTDLYYCGRKPDYLRELLGSRNIDSFMKYLARSVIFGHERVLPFLGREFKPISQDEIESEVRSYEAFADSFARDEVLRRPISYVVTLAGDDPDFSHIDLWYERDAGERIGDYNLYRLKLRQNMLRPASSPEAPQ